jgi:hypothetical protein
MRINAKFSQCALFSKGEDVSSSGRGFCSSLPEIPSDVDQSVGPCHAESTGKNTGISIIPDLMTVKYRAG